MKYQQKSGEGYFFSAELTFFSRLSTAELTVICRGELRKFNEIPHEIHRILPWKSVVPSYDRVGSLKKNS